uniref:DUF368 domain-containing protein n=1 Tax=Thaumasiovibrio occultus TaxID=1891184 RepID=UPI000B35BA85|nr:DUF368 domain-containing protein [Thaumasiovibrio occultus]
MRERILLFFKGMAMGAADVVPGVSGGTIALISGIYDTLLDSIRAINPSLWKVFRKEGLGAALTQMNAGFLITLMAGILTSILTLANLISYLLVAHPIPLWAFFFGLIIVSILLMLRQIKQWSIPAIVLFIGGIAFAWFITVASPLQMEATPVNLLIGGAIAICAMILPGISGSFILLLLGLYGPVIDAVKAFDIPMLSLFAVGCGLGLLSFSHLLGWLLKHFRDFTMVFLIGLMVGTLNKIWPWKEVISWRIDSSGEQVPLIESNLSPMAFEQITQQPAQLIPAILACVFGIAIVMILERIGRQAEAR